MDVNIEQLKALAELAKANELAEITISDGDKQITIKTPASVAHTIHQGAALAPQPVAAMAPPPAALPPAGDSTSAPPAPAAATADASLKTVTSPMVGTFYAASSPDTPPYVSVGTAIKAGQVLCIVEAMKQMNELESDVEGTIAEILVSNGEPVEYGQPLFKVR